VSLLDAKTLTPKRRKFFEILFSPDGRALSLGEIASLAGYRAASRSDLRAIASRLVKEFRALPQPLRAAFAAQIAEPNRETLLRRLEAFVSSPDVRIRLQAARLGHLLAPNRFPGGAPERGPEIHFLDEFKSRLAASLSGGEQKHKGENPQ
jgi:hypothetical protein